MWIFRYTDNQLLNTIQVDCTLNPNYVEIIANPKSGDHYVIEFWPKENSLIFNLLEPGQEWMLRSSAVDKDRIKLVEQTNFKEKYDTLSYNMNGHEIKAAFLHKAADSANQEYYWYLIGDRLYCRVLLNDKTFEECKQIPITEWIQDCKHLGGEGHVSDRKAGKDNTLVIAILVAVIVIAIIVIIVVVFFIVKEVKDQTTSTNTGTDPTIRSNN